VVLRKELLDSQRKGFISPNRMKPYAWPSFVRAMYFLNALALFTGGLIPLLMATRKLHFNRGLFLLGWLGWACAVSPKIVLLSALWASFPILAKPDTAPNVTAFASLELLEVASAYLFLSRHPRLRGANMNGRFVFALGFGVGEAFTVAISALLPVDITPSLSTLMVTVERVSLVVVQFGWVALISYYVATGESINLVLGVFFKILSPIISLTIPILLFLYHVAFEVSIICFGGVMAVYAAIVLMVALLLRRRVEDTGSRAELFDSRYLFASFIAFLGLALAVDTSISLLHLTRTLGLATRLLLFIVATMMLLELLSWAAKGTSLSETALGGFIGMLLENLFRFYFAKEALLQKLTFQEILLPPTSAFLTVLVGIAFWKYAKQSGG